MRTEKMMSYQEPKESAGFMQQLADEVDPFKDMKCTVDGLKVSS